ncbi:Gfo/Idh/MocA family protein [Pseudonocardia sp. KRD291]|uniref:Gfo/Idh/MocA family protein n=1 Tax=Pseudonocardia sp. KRD291 TaxID=2792007 RepID=UPI001C4A04B2|nr:Gfo/Idh/MocA family oxidoreductase [Pseudonocardia sp. KRD291]MBW0101548.1 Gfo/Idh/MocA family oxidoreductase [Pseudonocardia sp. KRD291]
MTRTLRAGLIGLGAMGRNHARVLQSLPDIEFVGAVDPLDPPQPRALRVEVLSGIRELVERGTDLCVVATPTHTHEAIALELAEVGIATLVEKPVAHDEKAAQRMVDAFDAAGVVGCVGHIERYNPALQDMRRRLARNELGEVFQVVTRRQGPFPARIADAGVILDLATHDIDLTAWVTGSPYRSVSARVAHRSGRIHEDLVSTVGELADGTVVTHLVNWLSPLKERVTTVTGEYGCFVADTLTADLTFFQNGSESTEWERVAVFRGVSEGNVTRFAIPKPEPLVTELSNFADAVRGEPADVVTMADGLCTVQVAEALRSSAMTGRTTEVIR